jgi:poly-gamma-glutamate capsule biosynthesis protein CapA/YwtB (metallophosphatase superfamily)
MSSALISLVGDVVLNRPDPASAFEHVQELFAASDVRFANCEAMYSRSTERHPLDPCATRVDPDNFTGVISAGFDVLSFANNHALGGGYGSFFETLDLMRGAGIAPVGAGMTRQEAMAPVIIERNGVRIAFLAFACVYYPGFEATATRPGVATLQAYTFYRQEVGQPGTMPTGVVTVADPSDKAAMVAAVESADADAHAVVVSMHWGIHHTEAVVADYERELGRAAIDAGADVVFGHHQHILKGIDLYKDRPIVHGANQFVFDVNSADLERTRSNGWVPAVAHDAKRPGIMFDSEYPSYPFRPDARRNLVARLRVGVDGFQGFDVRPCLINNAGQPVPLEPGDPAFDEWLEYMNRISTDAGLGAVMVGAGKGVAITPRDGNGPALPVTGDDDAAAGNGARPVSATI